MRSFKLAIVFCALAVFAASCGTNENQTTDTTARQATPTETPTAATPTPTPDEFAAARSDYNNTCIRCHKENGEGGTVEIDDGVTLKVPSFKSEDARKDSDKDFIRQINNGGDGMPAFKSRLPPERIADLVRFIRKEFQSDAKP